MKVFILVFYNKKFDIAPKAFSCKKMALSEAIAYAKKHDFKLKEYDDGLISGVSASESYSVEISETVLIEN